MAKPRTDTRAIRVTSEDWADIQRLKSLCGLGMQELFHQLFRRGEPYVAAWQWLESGILTRYPELQGEMKELLSRELQLRLDLGSWARTAAERMASSEDEFERFDAALRREGRAGYVKVE